MKNNDKVQIIYSTFPNKTEAKRLLRVLLERKLVACGNIVDCMESMYEWEGGVETSNECICILKTQAQNFAKIEEIFIKEHPYDTPCLIAICVSKVNSDFGGWIRNIC